MLGKLAEKAVAKGIKTKAGLKAGHAAFKEHPAQAVGHYVGQHKTGMAINGAFLLAPSPTVMAQKHQLKQMTAQAPPSVQKKFRQSTHQGRDTK